jgi:opacity protein-like surface antigen
MKHLFLTAICLGVFFASAPALADGNVNFLIGERRLQEDFWERTDLDRQGLFGMNFDYGQPTWPIRAMFGVHTSGAFDWDSGDNVPGFGDPEAVVVELSAGAAWMPLQGRTRPYIGAGVSRVGAWVDLFSDDYDSSFAYYVHGGVFWRLGSNFNFGFDLRTLQGSDLRFDAIKLGLPPSEYPDGRLRIDADGAQISFAIGFGWPGLD